MLLQGSTILLGVLRVILNASVSPRETTNRALGELWINDYSSVV